MGFFYVEATEEVKGNHLHLADLHGHLAVEKEFTEGRVVHLANQVDVLRGTDKAVHERGNLSEQKKNKKNIGKCFTKPRYVFMLKRLQDGDLLRKAVALLAIRRYLGHLSHDRVGTSLNAPRDTVEKMFFAD